MTAPLHVIAEHGSGWLATVTNPHADAWTAERLGALADEGISVLVSALTAAEQERLGAGRAADEAAEVGMDFISFPAVDDDPPREEATKVVLLAGRLAANVRAARCVAIQTFGGVGRSTLLACTTLVLLGVGPGEALHRVAGGAGTTLARDWLHELAPDRSTPH